MKFLFILGSPCPRPSAAWTRIAFFANAWSKRGHSSDVIGIFNYKSFQKRGFKKKGGLNIYNIIFNIGIIHPIFFTLNSMISLVSTTLVLIAKKPHVAIISVPPGDIGIGTLLACKLTGTKRILDYRDQWEDYIRHLCTSRMSKYFFSIMKKFMVALYTQCGLVVTVTPRLQISLKQRGVNSVGLIPNGADVNIFKPLKNSKNVSGFRVIFIGGATRPYCLDVLFKAMKLLVEKGVNDIQIIIVGAVQRKAFSSLNSSIQDKILFLGTKEVECLPKIIVESDIGIIPFAGGYLQAKTSWPVKFFEYCACGVPVIATVHEDSILANLIQDYEVGLTVPPMDDERLAEAIYRMYVDKSFRDASGKKARKLIEAKFNRHQIAEQFLTLIKSLF